MSLLREQLYHCCLLSQCRSVIKRKEFAALRINFFREDPIMVQLNYLGKHTGGQKSCFFLQNGRK